MVLIYHKTQSAEPLLQEGLKSYNILAQEGKREVIQNCYEIAVSRHREWVEERKVALKDDPALLSQILSEYNLEATLKNNPRARFDDPKHPGNRFDNVYFQFFKTPLSDSDWVAIDVPDTTLLHDATCRDIVNPELWIYSACSIKDFEQYKSQGLKPPRWHGIYNEHLIKDRVSSERIIAYAKLEKELPVEPTKATPDQLNQVQVYLSDKLSFATQFENPADNILISEKNGKYQIRISFNKNKVEGKESDVSSILQPIQSMSELIKKSQENNSIVLDHQTATRPMQDNSQIERKESNSPSASPRTSIDATTSTNTNANANRSEPVYCTPRNCTIS